LTAAPRPEDLIPNEWRARAYIANNGELAWPRGDALAVLPTIVGLDLAVLGGEVWMVDETTRTIRASLLGVDGHDEGIYSWEVQPGWDPTRESWPAFCARAAEVTAESIRYLREELVRADFRPRLRFNLTFVTQNQYVALAFPMAPQQGGRSMGR
jgi:hypothetical protein